VSNVVTDILFIYLCTHLEACRCTEQGWLKFVENALFCLVQRGFAMQEEKNNDSDCSGKKIKKKRQYLEPKTLKILLSTILFWRWQLKLLTIVRNNDNSQSINVHICIRLLLFHIVPFSSHFSFFFQSPPVFYLSAHKIFL
jgi:hypothetical protein